MECSQVQKRLSAYLEGSLSPEEQALVEKHLKPCEKCSQSLLELKRTLEHLQGLPEVEPPPWLAERVMARVRSEPEARRGIWQILFHPIHIKVPLEAAGVIAIAVTTIYLFKAMQPAMRLSQEPLEEIRPPAVSEVAKPPIPPESKAPPTTPGSERLPSPAPMPERHLPMAELGAAKEAYDEALTARRQMEDKAAPPEAELEVSKAEPGGPAVAPAVPGEETDKVKAPPPPAETLAGAGAREESELRAKAALAERAEKREAIPHLTLTVKDMEAATSEIEKGIVELGGKILQKERQENKTIVVAELSPNQLKMMRDKLKPLGEVAGEVSKLEAKEVAAEIVRIEILGIE